MSSTRFEALEWAAEGNDLLNRSRKILSAAPSEKVKRLASRIPDTVLSSDNTILLVFAGQYSSGKSTILKVLTGRDDIVIGSGITTEKSHTYEWNGIRVIDTPGVHTKIRPDHDEITYRSISEADLLVFVVTNELFDSHIAEHFRKLAIERDKAHEMMLVVNKMRRCAKGNSLEAQAILREDLRKVLNPFSPEDLHTAFIDAKAVIESKEEKDDSVARVLLKKSGIELFTKELNNFVREKGLTGRYTTALYNLEQVLLEAQTSESSGDKDVDALEELLLQRRRALLETQDRIPRATEGEIQRTGAKIRQEGRRIADMIDASADQKKVDRELQAAQERVQQYADRLGNSVRDVINKNLKDLDKRVVDIANSELAKELIPRLEKKMMPTDGPSKTPGKVAEISSKLGNFLIKNSFTPKAGGLGGLFQYSGTGAHEAVKNIGHFFGKSFKPWEAVKWARGVAKVGRVLAVAGVLLTFILQYKEDADAAQLEKDLRESRSAVRSGFNDAAYEIHMHYDKATDSYVENTLTSEIKAVDTQLAELRGMQKSRSDLFQGLRGLLEETRKMIHDLHAEKRDVI